MDSGQTRKKGSGKQPQLPFKLVIIISNIES